MMLTHRQCHPDARASCVDQLEIPSAPTSTWTTGHAVTRQPVMAATITAKSEIRGIFVRCGTINHCPL